MGDAVLRDRYAFLSTEPKQRAAVVRLPPPKNAFDAASRTRTERWLSQQVKGRHKNVLEVDPKEMLTRTLERSRAMRSAIRDAAAQAAASTVDERERDGDGDGGDADGTASASGDAAEHAEAGAPDAPPADGGDALASALLSAAAVPPAKSGTKKPAAATAAAKPGVTRAQRSVLSEVRAARGSTFGEISERVRRRTRFTAVPQHRKFIVERDVYMANLQMNAKQAAMARAPPAAAYNRMTSLVIENGQFC